MVCGFALRGRVGVGVTVEGETVRVLYVYIGKL